MRGVTRRLQETLESLYRVESPVCVLDFQMSLEHLEQLLGEEASSALRESFFVREEEDETLIALYIDDGILERAHHSLTSLSSANDEQKLPVCLDSLCVATEGVSHFLYFTFCGDAHERPVSQIELELQAEIDKFIVLWLAQAGAAPELIHRLFDQVEFEANLDDLSLERYRMANRTARRYARWLGRSFQSGAVEQALKDARRLYRMSLPEKLAHIAKAA